MDLNSGTKTTQPAEERFNLHVEVHVDSRGVMGVDVPLQFRVVPLPPDNRRGGMLCTVLKKLVGSTWPSPPQVSQSYP